LADRAVLAVAIAEAMGSVQAGRHDEALARIAVCAELAMSNALGAYYFGLIHCGANDRPTALAWFETALALQPDHRDALRARAGLLHQLGRVDESLAAHAAVLALDPDDIGMRHSQALLYQMLGRFEEAICDYEAVLAAEPDHPTAQSNLGIALIDAGHIESALDCFAAALDRRPSDPAALYNRAVALERLGRTAEALAAYEDASRHAPEDAALWFNQANMLRKLGRLEEALASCEHSLRLRPDVAEALHERAVLLHRLGRRREAVDAYNAALKVQPAYPEALCNLGKVLHELGHSENAILAFTAALRHQPGHLQALLNRANVLHKLDRQALAIADCNELLRLTPNDATAHCMRGAALLEQGELAQAQTSLETALALRPDYAEASMNLGAVHQRRGDYEAALAAYDAALKVNPTFAEALSNRGVALRDMGDFEGSIASFDAAIAAKPDYHDARNNRGGTLMLLGRFREGWDGLESRWDRPKAARKIFTSTCREWVGQPIEGHSLIVYDEQGLGDLVQFSRYWPMLPRLGAKVTILCRRNMHRLLRPLCSEGIRLVHMPGRGYDYQVALMSLARSFKTTLETIPASIPYLQAEPDLVALWAGKVGREGFRVGVCWHGNTSIGRDRAIPASAFAPLAKVPGVRLISLMHRSDEAPADGTIETLPDPLDAGPDSFVDTAAVMQNLDLIVTCDTSIAHLAGALGRPVWVVTKNVPDWRWLLERKDSPWYPTVQIYRQPERGRWDLAFEAVTRDLAAAVAAKA
jgi:tetratricopeptide (TPR) repeat protein